VAEQGREQDDLSATFGDLEPDTGVDGAHDLANMPDSDEPSNVVSDLERIAG